MSNPGEMAEQAVTTSNGRKVLWTGIADKKLNERYSNGSCMYLAIAFHQKFDFKIEAAITQDAVGEYIAHAWVVVDDKALDVDGTVKAASMHETYAFPGDSIRTYACDEILGGHINQQRLDEAHAIIDRFLKTPGRQMVPETY